MSLTDDPVEHVCRECWERLTPAERLEATRKYRLDQETTRTLRAFARVCDGALDGFHLPGLGTAGRN